MIKFISNLWWFLRHWKPFRIRFHSPRNIWRMAMKRQRLKIMMNKKDMHDVYNPYYRSDNESKYALGKESDPNDDTKNYREPDGY